MPAGYRQAMSVSKLLDNLALDMRKLLRNMLALITGQK